MNTKENLYSTGIRITHIPSSFQKDRYIAQCHWQSSGLFAQSGCMEGNISTKYAEESLEKAIEEVLTYMNKFGIEKQSPFILYTKDSNNYFVNKYKEESDKRKWVLVIE